MSKVTAETRPPPDARILAILGAAPIAGVPIQQVYSDKERDLLGVFAALGPDERTTLHARLTSGSRNDSVCIAFGQLAAERRARLLAAVEPKEDRHGR